ncbi:MAG: phytanoyl-CoA dioxygenase family protein [Alphaproteobacteria bacterium]|nr:phytanoyl-CoA dioxygenase family protein [Alphaproteobacteria bacterium]
MVRAFELSAEQVESFRRDGYLVVRGGFGPDAVKQLDTWVQEVVAAPEVPGKHWVYWETSRIDPSRKIICRIENLIRNHPGFAQLNEALKPPTSQLLGESAVLFKEKINFKMPGANGFAPHQDSQAGWDKYADFFISVMVCIDEATSENGCLKMVSGHHKRGLFRSWEPLTDGDMAGMNFVECPTKPGDVVFFDSFAPHSSEPNMTQTTRRLFFATYNGASKGDHMARYYEDKHASYPPDIEREAGKDYAFRV